MRVKEAFTKKGYWWIPEKPDNKLSGELSVSDSGAIALEVIGTFYDNPLTDYVPIILGTSEERKLISLVECHMKLPGFGNDEVIPSYMFQGIHVANRDELIFSKTIISVDGLYAWLPQVSPKFSRQTEMNITSSLSLELAFPKIESFEIDSSHRISFGYEHSGPRLGHGIKKYEFDLNAYLLIDHSEPTSWTDIEILLYRINIFFCFGLGEPQALSYVKVLPKGIDNNEYVDVFYPSFPHAEEPKLDHPIYHTLKHSKVENDLSSLLSKWLHYCDKYHYAFRLFFEATTSTRHYLENQFILLTQCLEAFHRYHSKSTRIPEADFLKLRELLVEACPDEHKSLLNENLKYWNGLSFRNRLKELFAPYKRYFKGYDSIDILIGQVVNTRNYYTHFDPSSEGAAITEGQALWKINNLLELLFELHLLSLLGFSESQIETIVHESERLKQKMHS